MAMCSTMTVAVGVLTVFLALKAVRAIAFRRFHAAGGFGGRMRFGGGGRRFGRSMWLRALFHRLDTTPGQEREIRAALEDLADRARDAVRGARAARESIARALTGDVFDDAAFEGASARVDAATAQGKDALRSALARIHAVLDTRQRARLAAFVEGGGGRGMPSSRAGGPYRGAGAGGANGDVTI